VIKISNAVRKNVSEEYLLQFDITRSLLLSKYIDVWGMPKNRQIIFNETLGAMIEIYEFFSSTLELNVSRFVTVGVSCQGGYYINHELCFILEESMGGAESAEVKKYLFDIATYSQRPDVNFSLFKTIESSPLAPQCWKTKALLIDSPRGEPEVIGHTEVGDRKIELKWVIPLHDSEEKYIRSEGIDAFGVKEQEYNFSLIDVTRSPIV
jgi:hypothetical protein